MTRDVRIAVGFIIFAGVRILFAATPPYESTIQSIDREVLAIDQNLAHFTKTLQQNCDEQACHATASYWDDKGRIRKIVKGVGSTNFAGITVGRFYSDCRLIFVRQTPNDEAKIKDLKNIEKYYFRKRKLLRVVFGDEIKMFEKNRMDDLQRSMYVEPAACFQ